MFFDDLFYFFSNFGWCVVLFLCFLKLTLLVWYKPHRLSFIVSNFLKLYLNMAYIPNRELANKKWPVFKKAHNITTIIFYTTFFLWGIFFLLLNLCKR